MELDAKVERQIMDPKKIIKFYQDILNFNLGYNPDKNLVFGVKDFIEWYQKFLNSKGATQYPPPKKDPGDDDPDNGPGYDNSPNSIDAVLEKKEEKPEKYRLETYLPQQKSSIDVYTYEDDK